MRLLTVRSVIYVPTISLVLYSCRLHLQSHELLHQGTTEVQQALIRTAIAVMENGEWLFLEGEAYRDAAKASQYEANAKYLVQRSEAEHSMATRSRTRGEYFEDLANVDAQQANRSYFEMLQDDKLRLELVDNLTTDKDELALLEREKSNRTFVLSRMCSCKVLDGFCNVFGGVPDLPKKIDVEIQQIVHQYRALCETERQEFLHGLVAEILQGYANKYNHTANDLLQIAKLYDELSKKDMEAARQYNDTANVLYQEEAAIEDRMQHELQWIKDNNNAADQLMHLAEDDMRTAHRFATEAALLALLSMLFIAPNLVHKCLFLVQNMVQADGCDTEKVVWRISYTILHVFIFLVVAGLVEPDFLMHLDSYDIPKRVMIIFWFAYLAAGLQTVLLHSVPQCMTAECPLDTETARKICVQFLLRMIVNTISYALELLLVWLLFRDTVFSVEHMQIYTSGVFYLLFVVLVSVHIVFLDHRQKWEHDGSTDQSTALLSDDDEMDDDASIATSTERSALISNGDESHSPTERMPYVYFQGFTRYSPSTSNSNRSSGNLSSSTYTMNIPLEGIKLLALLDTLLLACSWIVVQNGVAMSSARPVHKYIIALAWVSGAFLVCVALGMALVRYYRSTMLSTSIMTDEKPFVSSKTVSTYNSIEV
jgi:hypothetical protein